MTPRLRALVCILLAANAIALLIVLAFSPLASAYELEAGGRALEGRDPESALAHLNRSIAWHDHNTQGYRLLSRAYRATEDWGTAVEALTRYTELRPDNPLGFIELAELYQEIDSWIGTLYQVDLIELLPLAEITTPTSPIDTPYSDPSGDVWHGYVAGTTFVMPQELAGRATLFMHPRSQVTYTIQLPAEAAVLDFAMGMDPQVSDWPGDGVTFQVLVDGERIFFEHLDKDVARRGWQARTVKLEAWAGREIALSLGTGGGPAMDTSGDWAGWGTPRVVDARMPRYEAMDPGERALQAWRDAGTTQSAWIEKAKVAHAQGHEAEALAWYERAISLKPEVGDAWHELGLWHMRRQTWAEAVRAFEKALEIDHFVDVSASDPAYYAGIVYQRRLEPRDMYRAWALYDTALTLNEFSTPARLADCHYQRGEILRLEGRSSEEYMAAFKAAIAADPQHAWAHARLGYAYYEQDGDVAAAEAELKEAIALAPEDRWLYVTLGDVYRLAGRTDEARGAYEQALEINPEFKAALDRLQALDSER